ncbi:MAG TPA: hypothetical protein VG498_21305 [Terriglobales bacterium]|nr:hypothetical protein [Terriglobales bacterium]
MSALPAATNRSVTLKVITRTPGSCATVLFLDDDPQHLKLYPGVIERGRFTVIPLLVGAMSLKMPDSAPDIVALDYRPKGPLTALDTAKQLNSIFPRAPILILSELEWLPQDIAPYSSAFVRKGEPEKLINCLMRLTRRSD